jgi:beta-glucosidase-like glycosyl hydrolase
VLIKKIGEATALEVRATGIPYVFAPCIAVTNQRFNILLFESHITLIKSADMLMNYSFTTGLQRSKVGTLLRKLQ